MEKYYLVSFLILVAVITPGEISGAAIAERSDGESEDEVMALPDDVIIDALFTNIDTVQDQMELCEEGLRQKLVAATHGKTPYVKDFEDVVYKQAATVADDSENSDLVNQTQDYDNNEKPNNVAGEDSHGRADGEGINIDVDDVENDALFQHSTRVKLSHSETTPLDRERRSARAEGQGQDQVKTEDEGHEETQHHIQPSRHHQEHQHHRPSPTEAVVNRLSERLEYLKRSLLSCYALYRQL